MSKLLLKFEDRRLEREFRESYDNEFTPIMRIGYIVGGMLYAISGLLDFILIPGENAYTLKIRYLVVCPMVPVFFALSYIPFFKKRIQLLTTILILIGGLGVIGIIAVAPPPADNLYYTGLILFAISTTFARIRHAYSVFLSLILFVGYEMTAIFIKNTPNYILANNNFFLVSAILLCGYVSYTMERYARTVFLQLQIIKDDAEKLRNLNEELEILSIQDHLTGLYNRRFLDFKLNESIALWNRYKIPHSFILIDLDGFKDANDIHGHEFGDNVLKKIAELFRNELRESDMAFRHGGDEFCILLPNTGLNEALEIGKRLLNSLNSVRFGDFLFISLSGGCISLSDSIKDAQGVLRKADELLYEAKKQGGNKIMW